MRLLLLAVAAASLLGPAGLAAPQDFAFHFDPGAWAQPGQGFVLTFADGAFVARLEPVAQLVGGFAGLDVCATATLTGPCTGMNGPHGAFPGAFGIAGAASGIPAGGVIDTTADYGDAGSYTFRCVFSGAGSVLGALIVPPGSGACRFVGNPNLLTGPWQLTGSQSDGIVGGVVHSVR